jgi:hypothetical protein
MVFTIDLSVSALSITGEEFLAWAGFEPGVATTSAPANLVGLRIAGSVLQAVTMINGAETATDSGTAIAAATPFWVSVHWQVGVGVLFYHNGVLFATHATSIPSTGNGYQTKIRILKSSGSTNRTLSCGIPDICLVPL